MTSHDCGDDEGSDGDYYDQKKTGGSSEEEKGDWVGDKYGDRVDRRGQTRSLKDVEQYDSDNPEATPEDWDAFFEEGESDSGLVDLDLTKRPSPTDNLVIAKQVVPDELLQNAREEAESLELSRSFDQVAEIMARILNRFKRTIGIISFWSNAPEVSRLKGELSDVLLASNIEKIEDNSEKIVTEITNLAKVRHRDILA